MILKNILTISNVVISILLILSVLIQQQGSGLGRAFGGDSGAYRTRRGAEKFLFWATIILAALFAVLGVSNVLIKS